MAWKPRKRRGSAACQDKAPKGETLSYLRVSVRHVWQKLDCLKPSSKACIATQRRKESCKAASDCQGIWCYCILKTDRKSTRLNSSHLVISYAVFCLKKKKIKIC